MRIYLKSMKLHLKSSSILGKSPFLKSKDSLSVQNEEK